MGNSPSPLTKRLFNFMSPGCSRLEPHYPPRQQPDFNADHPIDPEVSNFPRISIVIPSYNQGRFIRQTLKSITEQKYPNLELIIVDGGSDDETLDIIKQYENHINWWVSEPDDGQSSAINKGMQHATGEILAWLNSDDCLMPNALTRIAQQFMTSEHIGVVYGHRLLINEAGEDIGQWVMPAHRTFILSYADFIPQETMYWRAELWREIGGEIDESFRFAMDWELIRRFLDAGATFKLIPAFLGQFRVHNMQKTKVAIETDGFLEMERIRKQCQQRFSKHPALQNLYYRMQRAGLYSFLLRARCTELLWKSKLIKID